jgi:hyperosmotically inducible protein
MTMKHHRIGTIGVLVLALVLVGLPMLAMGDTTQLGGATTPAAQAQIAKQVRHNLLMLPFYGIFDNLEYAVQGDHVVLSGQVVWPTTKSDAENAVKGINGVTGVTNNIQVLPLSRFDNQIRFAEYRAIFRQGSLYRYAMGANPSIHIIVDNGHVTLVGYVANKTDSNLAYIAANGVPGVFSVTNKLQVG